MSHLTGSYVYHIEADESLGNGHQEGCAIIRRRATGGLGKGSIGTNYC